MGVRGLNHLTLAVAELNRALTFYRDVLGCKVAAVWSTGAYLEAGSLWLCLSVDAHASKAVRADYTHFAFDIDPEEFDSFAAFVKQHAPVWKDNRSEGPSLYFLDPDGHKLEIHAGSLASRLAYYRKSPPLDMTQNAQPGCA